MLQRAITCDQCKTVTALTDNEYDKLVLDAVVPDGWTRVTVVRPRKSTWREDAVLFEGEADLCCLYCASTYLSNLYNTDV